MNFDVLREIGAVDPLTVFPPAPSRASGGFPLGGFGSLGGLGGAPAMRQQQQGGGGIGAFFRRPENRDLIQAIGSSLISSPRNNPLAHLPQYLDAYQDRTQKRQEGLRDREAIKAVLRQYGASEQEAEQLSYSEDAANLWLKQRANQQALSADSTFNQSLMGVDGGTGGPGNPFPAGSSRTASGGAPSDVPMLATSAGNQPVDGPTPINGQIILPGAAGGRMDELLKKRNAYVQLGAKASTPEQMAKIRVYLDNVDKEIEREDERNKPTEALRDLAAINQQRAAAGLPGYRLDEWQQLKARSGATNIDMKGETKYDETLNTEFAKRAIGIEDQATSARRALGTLKQMETAISDPGFYSGTGSGAVTNLKRMAESLGLPGAEGIDSIEAFNAMSKQAALDAMGGSLGSGFSNADRSFVEEQVANLGNTAEGNKRLIAIQRATANRQLEIARLARGYAEKNGGRIDTGFYDRLAQWAEQNPLFPDAGNAGRQPQGEAGPSRIRNPGPAQGSTSRGLNWKAVQ